MPGILQKALNLITGAPQANKRPLKQLTERDLIKLESEIGSKLFGEVPAGHRREFFCLDDHTWIWYEEWIDQATKKHQELTTRYEVHQNGILKVQEGQAYKFVEGQELKNFNLAINMYYEQVMRGVYKLDPKTGQPLTQTPPATIDSNG